MHSRGNISQSTKVKTRFVLVSVILLLLFCFYGMIKSLCKVPVCTSSGACLTKAIGEVAIGQAFPQPSRSRPLDEGQLAER